jgi:hypothetical protein
LTHAGSGLNAKLLLSKNKIRAGQKITAIVKASGGKKPYAYQWKGHSSKSAQAVYSFKKPGKYTVLSSVSDAKGSGLSVFKVVEVLAAPLSVKLHGSHTKLKPEQPAKFTAAVGGGMPPYKYYWLDRKDSKPGVVNIKWSKPGRKNVSVLVKDSESGTAKAQIQITVVSPCQVKIKSSPNPIGKKKLIPVRMGELKDLSAFTTGCKKRNEKNGKVIRYKWSGPSSPNTGVDWSNAGWTGDASSITFASRKLGERPLSVNVADAEGNKANDWVTMHVGGWRYQVKCSPGANPWTSCNVDVVEHEEFKGHLKSLNVKPIIRWEPHGGVQLTVYQPLSLLCQGCRAPMGLWP